MVLVHNLARGFHGHGYASRFPWMSVLGSHVVFMNGVRKVNIHT